METVMARKTRRLAGGGVREQLPPPQEEDAAYPGDAGYFEQQADVDHPSATGLGRKRSLMQRVGGVVRGKK